MNIVLAEHAGFCFGVKRAVELAENEVSNGNCAYTLGPIVHNDEVINSFKKQGVSPISIEEAIKLPPGRIVIRAHGIPKNTQEELEKAGHTIIDATCPFVKKIHNIVFEKSEEGYFIIVIGDRNHPEVQGIVGWITGDRYCVIKDEQEAKEFTFDRHSPICLVSQTTYNNNKFKDVVEILNKKGYDIDTLDTICKATYVRQREAEEIATKVDAMIVIGDRNSSNSRKLFDIAKGKCKSYFIQTKSDLDSNELYSIETVGITAGASTPDNIIREVMKECQK